jgi:hypothetical protein
MAEIFKIGSIVKTKYIKIRMHSWYWGNFCLFKMNQAIPKDFELYKEDIHGWHNSEEFKNGRLEPYQVSNLKYSEL